MFSFMPSEIRLLIFDFYFQDATITMAESMNIMLAVQGNRALSDEAIDSFYRNTSFSFVENESKGGHDEFDTMDLVTANKSTRCPFTALGTDQQQFIRDLSLHFVWTPGHKSIAEGFVRDLLFFTVDLRTLAIDLKDIDCSDLGFFGIRPLLEHCPSMRRLEITSKAPFQIIEDLLAFFPRESSLARFTTNLYAAYSTMKATIDPKSKASIKAWEAGLGINGPPRPLVAVPHEALPPLPDGLTVEEEEELEENYKHDQKTRQSGVERKSHKWSRLVSATLGIEPTITRSVREEFVKFRPTFVEYETFVWEVPHRQTFCAVPSSDSSGTEAPLLDEDPFEYW